MQTRYESGLSAPEVWTVWPVNWSAVWVGALAALAAALILGLISTALGATAVRTLNSWNAVSRADVFLSVFAAFLAFVAGGWVAAKIAGIRHAEPAILHAVISWLIALPLLLVLLAFGAGNAYGGWYGGIMASPLVAAAPPATPEAIRHTALAALTAIILGLVGAVIGGWMATGEPMTFTHHRTRGITPSLRERGSLP